MRKLNNDHRREICSYCPIKDCKIIYNQGAYASQKGTMFSKNELYLSCTNYDPLKACQGLCTPKNE
ncbi:MAG: hypothetical protein V1870_02525 [Candidatus Aenigmatarchaeota archaeon]